MTPERTPLYDVQFQRRLLPAYLDGNAIWVESTGKSLNSRLATISDASSAVASAAARSDALCTAELDDDDE